MKTWSSHEAVFKMFLIQLHITQTQTVYMHLYLFHSVQTYIHNLHYQAEIIQYVYKAVCLYYSS